MAAMEGIYSNGTTEVIKQIQLDSSGNLKVSAVTITGPVTISNEVEIKNDTGNPVPIAGSAAVGSAPTAPPLSISGVDGSGLKRHLLTDANGIQQVGATARTCTGRTSYSVSTAVTLASICSGAAIPVGSVTAMIQADGGSIRVTLEGTTPTASVGMRIDDGVMYMVDSSLANVKLFAATATTVQVAFFDRV